MASVVPSVKVTAQNQHWTIGDYTVSARDILGRGAYGVVYRGKDDKGKEIAAKSISSKHHPRFVEKQFDRLFTLSHPNIIKMLHIFHDNESSDCWMFMELCKLGDLNKFFCDRDVASEQKMEIMKQTMTGLKYLHDNNVIHRDIKPGNILMQRESPVSIKLTDFDVSKFLEDDLETSAMTSNVGTSAFKALEFYRKKGDGKIRYHRNVDIYASGLTFLAILQAKKGDRLLVPHLETEEDYADSINPIASTIATRIKYNHVNLNIVQVLEAQDQDWTPEDMFKNDVRKLIQKMTSIDPQDRPSAAEILILLQDMQGSDSSATKATFAQPTLTFVRKRGVNLSLENISKKLKTTDFTLTQLVPTDREYAEVTQEFKKTCRRKILKIEKVDNKDLLDQYTSQKTTFEARSDQTLPSERRLWHGADDSTVNKISANGFVLAYGGKNAVLYGQGVYFSGKACTSERHCPPDTDGTSKLFHARVLTGRYTRGDKSMRSPPPLPTGTDPEARDSTKGDPRGDVPTLPSMAMSPTPPLPVGENPTECYDSTVDNPDDPNIFVIYDNSQAFPEYLVTFR